MAVELNHHIKLIGDNPLDAVLVNRHTKAYLIANLAFSDGAEAAAEHYGLSLATIYATMSFYEDNREAIQQAIKDEREAAYAKGAIDGKEAIAEFKRRMENKK